MASIPPASSFRTVSPMRPIVECVPSFSEGRNSATVRALVQAVKSVPDVWLLDQTMDADHHRAVLTFAGSPEGAVEAAFRAIRVATDLIDLRRHEGAHPRVGSTDVVPFIPIRGVTMADCVHLAKQLGQRVGTELDIPVFLYEQAAVHPDHARLESVRRGGLKGLAFRMECDADWLPDYGPPRLHESAGAIVIGARKPLIALNVNLHSKDVVLAKSIARTIRQSSGGLSGVKAIGVELPSRGLVQVAMNVTDHEETPVHVAFKAVAEAARKQGVEVAETELIGLVPQKAMVDAAAHTLRLGRFDMSQVLEYRLEQALDSDRAPYETPFTPAELAASVSPLLEAVASSKPAPAGGSVAAVVGALAASLGAMGAKLGRQRAAEHRLDEISERLRKLMAADIEAYHSFIRAANLPRTQEDRGLAVATALHVATEVPLEVAELACEAGLLLHACLGQVKAAVQSDLNVGMLIATAAAEAGLRTVQENMKRQANQQLKASLTGRIRRTEQSLVELKTLCYTPPSHQW